MSDPVLGWDIGGANIKAAFHEPERASSPTIVERHFPIWREPGRLASVLTEIAATFAPTRSMAVTMTAELSDCFATKHEGVLFVLDSFREAFPAVEPAVFCVDGQFRTRSEASQRTLLVSAANWVASAMIVARAHPDALFIDVGSTTTDVIPIVRGRIAAQGRTDVERLRAGELVYTGALRTPVCAIVQSVPLATGPCRVAAEFFATAADVHLWLGHITESEYTCETADGRGCSRNEVAARLARIVCADPGLLDPGDIDAMARHIASAQVHEIAHAIDQVVAAAGMATPPVSILAGHGAFLAEEAARALGLQTRRLADDIGGGAANAAPAAAVACLLAEQLEPTRA